MNPRRIVSLSLGRSYPRCPSRVSARVSCNARPAFRDALSRSKCRLPLVDLGEFGSAAAVFLRLVLGGGLAFGGSSPLTHEGSAAAAAASGW